MFLPCSHLSTYTWDLLLTQWVTIGETSHKRHLMGISGWGNWRVLISAVWVIESDTDTWWLSTWVYAHLPNEGEKFKIRFWLYNKFRNKIRFGYATITHLHICRFVVGLSWNLSILGYFWNTCSWWFSNSDFFWKNRTGGSLILIF
jgi:hypothetical protein